MLQNPIPAFRRALDNGRHLITLAKVHAAEKGIADEAILRLKLSPDMLDFAHQWTILVDGIRGAALRLAGRQVTPADLPSAAVFNRADGRVFELADSLDGILAQLEACSACLDGIAVADISADENRLIEITMGGHTRRFTARPFLEFYVLPNVYFHLTIAYALLRQAGFPVGKADYEGADIYDLVTA